MQCTWYGKRAHVKECPLQARLQKRGVQCEAWLAAACRAFVGAERAVVPDSNDAAAVPLQAWSSQRGPEPV